MTSISARWRIEGVKIGYIYLPLENLAALKMGYLSYLRPAQLGVPWLHASSQYQRLARVETKIGAGDYRQHLRGEYDRLPDHLRQMLTFDYFLERSKARRSEIERGMLERLGAPQVAAPLDLAALQRWRILRLFSRPDSPAGWAQAATQDLGSEIGQGLVLEVSLQQAGFQGLDGVEHRLAAMSNNDAWPGEAMSDYLLQQPSWQGVVEAGQEWRLLRLAADAERRVRVKGQEHSLFKLPYRSIRRIIFGYGCPPARCQSLSKSLHQDLNLRHVGFQQLQLTPGTLSLARVDLSPAA